MKKPAKAHPRLGIKIQEIMTRDVVTIRPGASVREAARTMSERDVGLLPVCKGGRVLGLLTDRDITVRAIAEGLDPRKTEVQEIMTTDVYFCYGHEDVQDAVESFEKKQIRRLIILNRKKALMGVLSIGDLAVDSGDNNLAGEVLKRVSEPEPLHLQRRRRLPM